ncbi:MAG: class I SAM-dependent methyltransferase [Acutalibacteraceae bacterium]|nr:class I SAM-dependent methyltransferase [Acutalibacteraceae bacterium]
MSLSRRLLLIASLVPKGARVCDVGTDHARLPIFLIEEKTAERVIATDIRPLPLENAKKNVEASGISGIELRLCDGLSAVKKNETDTVIIAGIGGEVISGIISRAELLQEEPYPLLILQPTTSPEALRRYLCDSGFEILTENPLKENGKLYSVMTARFTGQVQKNSEHFYYIGIVNPNTEDGYSYIQKQYTRLKKCADALINLPEKQTEYLHYKNLSDEIQKTLTAKQE